MGKTDNAKTRPAALPGEGRQSGAKRLWAKGEQGKQKAQPQQPAQPAALGGLEAIGRRQGQPAQGQPGAGPAGSGAARPSLFKNFSPAGS